MENIFAKDNQKSKNLRKIDKIIDFSLKIWKIPFFHLKTVTVDHAPHKRVLVEKIDDKLLIKLKNRRFLAFFREKKNVSPLSHARMC